MKGIGRGGYGRDEGIGGRDKGREWGEKKINGDWEGKEWGEGKGENEKRK